MVKFLITIRQERLYEIEVDAKDQDDANEVAEQIIDSQEYRSFVSDDQIELVSVDPVAPKVREAA